MECDHCGQPLEYDHAQTVHLEDAYLEADAIGRASTEQEEYVFVCRGCGEGEAGIKFFSLTIRPGAAEDRDVVLQFCREEGIVGTGWGHEGLAFDSPEQYLRHRRGSEPGGGTVLRAIKDFVIWMRADDIVLLYDKPSSQYFLAQITGEWQYVETADLPNERVEEYKRHDVWQFREAEWHQMPRKYLTGDVLSGTPPPQSTIHKKDFNEEQAKYLALLPEQPDVDSETNFARLQDRLRQRAFGPDGDPREIIRPLTDEELETVVINYVQRHTDAVLMQNTTGDALPDVESLLRRVGDDGRPRTIGTQVKRGGIGSKGDLENFLDNADELFVYCRGPSGIDGATEITDREIAGYMCYYTAELPPSAILRLTRLYE